MATAYIPAQQTALGDLPALSQVRFFVAFIIKTAVVFGVFCALLVLKNLLCFSRVNTFLPIESGTVIFALLVLAWCVGYDIFFIISEGYIKKAIVGLFLSFLSAVLVRIYPQLGVIFAVLAIISMVKTVIGVLKMIPYLLLGVLITALMFLDIAVALIDKYELLSEVGVGTLMSHFSPLSLPIYSMRITVSPLMIPYLILTLLVSINLSFKYNLKMALFRQTIIFLSLPVIILMVFLIHTMISRALCEPATMQQASVGRGKIWVQPYCRLDGTLVSGYWRSI